MILTGKLIEPFLSTPNFNSKVTKFRAFLEESLNVVMALTVNGQYFGHFTANGFYHSVVVTRNFFYDKLF